MDTRAEAVIDAFVDRSFCVWAAAYVISHIKIPKGGSPAVAIESASFLANVDKYSEQVVVLRRLAEMAQQHNITWAEVGMGGVV